MTGSPFSSARRAPTRWWRRGLTSALILGVVVLIAWALLIGALWGYSWFKLGGLDLRATDPDIAALGSIGAQAPADATTVMVVLTESRDPTIPREPDLVGPVALLQVSPDRTAPAVLVMPTELPVNVEGLGRISLNEVHLEGGEDLLARAVIDYTEVRIDHVVSFTVDALPQMVEALGDVQRCTVAACRPADPDEVREAQRQTDGELYVRSLTEVLRGVGEATDRTSVLRSPLTAKRVIDIVADEVRTDVSLRGRTLLEVADGLAAVGQVQFDQVPVTREPTTGELVPLEEPAMVRFQHLRDGTPLGFDEEEEPEPEVIEEELLESVEVAILNGAGIDGLAGQIQVQLEAEGFRVVGTGNAATFDEETTVVAYGPDPETNEAAALLLAEALGSGVRVEALTQAPTFEGEPVDVLVTIGADMDSEGG